jgi:ABC-type multidrug transport system ATPase subunit
MTDTRLYADEVNRTFGDVAALTAVNLDVPAAAVTALVGPNGSGKTTLLRLLAGLDEPTAGTVAYHGPAATREVGYLPQRPSFRPGFTVAETLGFYARLVDDDPDRLVERVGLSAAADRRIEALSGGMTRLVGVAQSLAGSPPVVVLDEPGSGLDPEATARVFDVVERLAADGRTVVISSHDLALVERTADCVAVLDGGELVAHDSPAGLRASWGGPLVETVVDHVDGITTTPADEDTTAQASITGTDTTREADQ